MLAITVGPQGQTQSMYSDAFHIGFLGPAKVRRATEIVFNEETQKWDIHFNVYDEAGQPKGSFISPELSGFDKYESARRIEVAWLNQCRALATDPTSPRGLQALELLRQ